MEYSDIINTIDSVIRNSELSQEKETVLEASLNKIRKRVGDSSIYLGIVGEFSSGKSTLINALIGADFFVTNAIQGTTTVITKLVYSDTINLVLRYNTGQTLSYSRDKRDLLEFYLPEVYSRLSFMDKFLMKIKGYQGLNRFDEYFMQLFDVVTTSNEISATLDEVVVYYPSPILRNGLVIVDTPGTDSLVAEHNQITRRAIREVCDLALVVVPATTPLSMTLVDFLEDNLRENIDKCRFLITKIELLRRPVEREHLLKGVTKRIEQLLGVKQPIVISAPTLVSLEFRKIVESEGLLKHLSYDEKENLTDNFRDDISIMQEEIQCGKDSTIHSKIKYLVEKLNYELSNELLDKKQQLEDEIREVKLMRAKPLLEFMNDFYAANVIYSLSYIESRISNFISQECNYFRAYVNRVVNEANSKDEVQNTMKMEATQEYGVRCFDYCYSAFYELLNETIESFETNFRNFREQFTNSYGIESVDFTYKLYNNPSWERKFDFSYSKSGLTTFPVFRFFKSLESVKEEMIDDVNPKINKAFSKIEVYYINKLQKAYVELGKQMEKVQVLFIKKYQKVIDRRIAESDKMEHQLQLMVENLKHQKEVLKSINM